MMKKIIYSVCLLLLTSCVFAANQTPVTLDKVVAVVNNEIITSSQLNLRIAQAKQQLKAQNIQAPAADVLKQQVLQLMINQTLQLQTAKQANISVTDAELQQAVQNIAQSENISTKELFAGAEKAGISSTALLQDLKNQLIVNKLQRAAVSSHVVVRPAEIDAYLRTVASQNKGTQYHLQDIVIALPEDPTPDQIAAAERHAQHLIEQINKGADFKALAAAESSGPEAMQGGDLGWRSLAGWPVQYAKAVQNLSIGQVSEPIRTSDGIHILMLAGVSAGQDDTDPTKLRQQISDMLFKRKFEEQLYIWQQQLRDTAYIKIMQ